MHKPRIVFSADANKDIGLGHIYRCIALAQILNSDFSLSFLIISDDIEIKKLLINSFNLIEKKASESFDDFLVSNLKKEDIVILDGYSNTLEIQKKYKKYAKALVSIDDLASSPFVSDIIFNHGDIAVLPEYKISSTAKIYSGLDFLILRPEFLKAAKSKSSLFKKDGIIFLSFGGTDPYNITPLILRILHELGLSLEINIVTGLKSTQQKLLKLIDNYPLLNIKIHLNLNASEIISLLNKATLAITTASTSGLEVCCCGVPLLVGTVVDNQKSINSILVKNNCAVSVQNWILASEEMIKDKILFLLNEANAKLIINAQNISIDGNSIERIRSIFKSL